MTALVVAWLLGAAFGGFTVWLMTAKLVRLYRGWYWFCRRILEQYLKVEIITKWETGYIRVDMETER